MVAPGEVREVAGSIASGPDEHWSAIMQTAARSFRVLSTFTLVAALCLSSLVAFSPGCASETDVRAQREQTAQAKASVDQGVADLSKQQDAAKAQAAAQEAALQDSAIAAARIPDGPQKVAAEAAVQAAADKVAALKAQIASWQAAIDSGIAKSAELGARIAAGDAILATLNQPSPSVQLVSTIAGGFSPLVGMLTAAIGALGVNQVRLKRAKNAYEAKADRLADGAGNIVRSIDVLAGIAPEVAAALQKHKDQIRLIQNGTGAKIIELVKGNPKVSTEAVVAAA